MYPKLKLKYNSFHLKNYKIIFIVIIKIKEIGKNHETYIIYSTGNVRIY